VYLLKLTWFGIGENMIKMSTCTIILHAMYISLVSNITQEDVFCNHIQLLKEKQTNKSQGVKSPIKQTLITTMVTSN